MNKVMKLWTVVVTAFVALFTALGLVTTTAAAAVPQTQPARNNAVAHPEPLAMHGLWSYVRSLPPTMKQRIRAEAHGKTPSCRSCPSPTPTRPRPRKRTQPHPLQRTVPDGTAAPDKRLNALITQQRRTKDVSKTYRRRIEEAPKK